MENSKKSSEKILFVKGEIKEMFSKILLFMTRERHIIKGKSDGIITLPQSKIPSATESFETDGKRIKSIKKETVKIKKTVLLTSALVFIFSPVKDYAK